MIDDIGFNMDEGHGTTKYRSAHFLLHFLLNNFLNTTSIAADTLGMGLQKVNVDWKFLTPTVMINPRGNAIWELTRIRIHLPWAHC